MTVRDLWNELARHSLDLEVLVVRDAEVACPLLGVVERDGKVFLDPGPNEVKIPPLAKSA